MNITKISDFLSGKNVEEYYQLYISTQWYDKKRMEEYQFNKLRNLIKHVHENVPFYKKYMADKDITPDNFTSIKSLELFPIITKEIIQDNYKAFIPENLEKIKGVKTGQTGGTTGNILYNRNDAATRSSTWAAFKRFEDWMKITRNDKTLSLMGGHVIGHQIKHRIKNSVKGILKNKISFSPYDTSEENINNIIEVLKSKNISFIRSYSQFLFSLSHRLKNAGLSFNIKAISTTAEPLTEEHRNLFKEVFNAEIFDQYGFGEIGGVAFECDHHKGLHITEERAIVEVNDNNELIVTDLDNYAMPFLRYWNADQAIIDEELCSCGRKSALIKKIMGRTCDYIIGLNGEFLHWAYFWHLLFDSEIAKTKNLRKFQVRQKSRDELIIRLVSDPISPELQNILISNIQSRIGAIQIRFSFEKDIENSASGKYRPVVNELL